MRKILGRMALGGVVLLLMARAALGALVVGTLPTTGFTFTSDSINEVNMAGSGVHLKTKGPVDVKTTYSVVAPSATFEAGWHYHNGPVIVTVTVGTLTFFDESCGTWDLGAAQTYIESTGEILNAKALPEKNAGIANVEWFTTRFYPDGATDPVPVTHAPC